MEVNLDRDKIKRDHRRMNIVGAIIIITFGLLIVASLLLML